jgi:predicted NBD/HSP70 family sugar kinase
MSWEKRGNSKMRIVTLDIGGTAIKSAVWDGQALSEKKETPTNASMGGKHIMECATDIIHSYASEGVNAIGISTAGEVDTTTGSIYHANDNLPSYTGMPVAAMLREEFGVPVAVENDVNCAALGEMYKGAAQNMKDFLCLTYGTGVGGAIVIDRKLYAGSSYSGGSFGGIVTHPEKMIKDVEFSGCYEKYASTTGLVRSAIKVDPTLDNGRKIFAARGRKEIHDVVDKWIDEVVIGLVTLVHVFNPSDVILGGGVMSQEWLVQEIEQRLTESVAPGFRKIRLHGAKLSNDAGMMGAAYLAEKLL